MEIVETTLPCTVSSPHVARVFLRRVLHAWHLDGLSDVSELLATELVANVVTHVGGPMLLRAVRDGIRVRVEIDDPSPIRPVVRHPAVSEEHGRGMLLVEQLADVWGVDWRPDGKTVWFELDAARVRGEVVGQGVS
jgi:anti-sigma regulatory factor (Ser/Thr protein kinase)